MSNKRILKRNINEMVFDVVEECFHHQMLDESKAPATEKLITSSWLNEKSYSNLSPNIILFSINFIVKFLKSCITNK